MIKKDYINFDVLFYEFNQYLLLYPENFDYVNSAIGYVENIILHADFTDCSLNIGDFGYKINKWTSFTKQLIDKDKFRQFKEDLQTTNSNCMCYKFESNSIISVILKRHDYRGKFKTCDVYFQRAELCSHFAVDLVFLSVFLKSLPNVNLSGVNIYISQGFVPATYITGLLDYFDLGIEELNEEHPFVKAMVNAKKKYYNDKEHLSSYESLLRIQKVYFEQTEIPNIRVLDLEIGE